MTYYSPVSLSPPRRISPRMLLTNRREGLLSNINVSQGNTLNRSRTSHRNVNLGAADDLSLTARSLHRRGPPTGVTFNVVVSFPGCGTHLDRYYTQFCMPSSLCWEETSLWVVPGDITPACMPSSLAGSRYTLGWAVFSLRSAYDTLGEVCILHWLSSSWCWLLVSSSHSASWLK